MVHYLREKRLVNKDMPMFWGMVEQLGSRQGVGKPGNDPMENHVWRLQIFSFYRIPNILYYRNRNKPKKRSYPSNRMQKQKEMKKINPSASNWAPKDAYNNSQSKPVSLSPENNHGPMGKEIPNCSVWQRDPLFG